MSGFFVLFLKIVPVIILAAALVYVRVRAPRFEWLFAI